MRREKDNLGSNNLALNEIMLEFVRAAVLEREPQIPSNETIDWDKLMDISTEQGLIAWVWDGICKLPQDQQPPRQQRIDWGLSAQEIWQRYEHQKEVLAEMVEICRQNGIRLLLMKGLGLSELYPKPQSRPFGDIDIYLFDDFEKGNLLFSDCQCPENVLHTSFYYNGVKVENHKILIYKESKTTSRVANYLSEHMDDVVIGVSGYYLLPPMANLAYLLMHALNHVDYEANTILPIRNILDLGLFLLHNKKELPPMDVYKTLEQLRLHRSFELIVYLSEWLLDVDFKEYHVGLVKRKDVSVIHTLFLKQGLSVPIVNNQSVFMYSSALWKKYYLLKPISKYISKKRSHKLLPRTIHRQTAYCIRRLFSLSDEYTIKDGLKLKLKLRV